MSSQRVAFLSDCPAASGFGGVVALSEHGTGRLVFYAPCCGVAWRDLPMDGRLNTIESLEELIGAVRVRALSGQQVAELLPNVKVLWEEPLDDWADDIPGLVRD